MFAIGTWVVVHAYKLEVDLAHQQIFLVLISDYEHSL